MDINYSGVSAQYVQDQINAAVATVISYATPVGAVVAWLKSLTGTPSIPSGWVECNGQTISDGDSVYDGVTIPDLNGSVGGALLGRYLRGDSTSGTTQADDNKPHTHTIARGNASGTTNAYGGSGSISNMNTGSSGTAESRPYTYTVVWIMRIK